MKSALDHAERPSSLGFIINLSLVVLLIIIALNNYNPVITILCVSGAIALLGFRGNAWRRYYRRRADDLAKRFS